MRVSLSDLGFRRSSRRHILCATPNGVSPFKPLPCAVKCRLALRAWTTHKPLSTQDSAMINFSEYRSIRGIASVARRAGDLCPMRLDNARTSGKERQGCRRTRLCQPPRCSGHRTVQFERVRRCAAWLVCPSQESIDSRPAGLYQAVVFPNLTPQRHSLPNAHGY